MNIKIVGQGCCDLDPIQQKTNMESFAALNPDIVTCQPQDLDVCAPTFDPLWLAGVKLTFPRATRQARNMAALSRTPSSTWASTAPR